MFDQHELGRAAADVEDQRRPAAGLEQFVAAEHRQPGFFLRRDDVERDPGFAAHPLDELAAVDRAATGLGGDRAGDADVAADQLVGADRQGADRAVHRLLAELAGLAQTLAEADDARESVDDGETLVDRAGDEEPAIVGAKVERAIGVARRTAPLASRDSRRAAPSWRGRPSGDRLRHRNHALFLRLRTYRRLTWRQLSAMNR